MFANIGWPQLLIVLVIALVIFGSKRLRTLGADLGNAVKGFRRSMKDAEDAPAQIGEDATFDADDAAADSQSKTAAADEPRKDN